MRQPAAGGRYSEESDIDRVLRNQWRWDGAVLAGLSYINASRQATLTVADVEAFLRRRPNPLTPSRLSQAAAEAMRVARYGMWWLPSKGHN
jgi:hypothetical protein